MDLEQIDAALKAHDRIHDAAQKAVRVKLDRHEAPYAYVSSIYVEDEKVQCELEYTSVYEGTHKTVTLTVEELNAHFKV